MNGSRGTVVAVDSAHGTLTVQTAAGVHAVNERYLAAGGLDHGYALTVHKAQGMTTDRTYLLGSDALYREAGYVGLSRGRLANHLYVVNDDIDEIRSLALEAAHGADALPTEPVAALIAALQWSRAQLTATELKRASDARETRTPERAGAEIAR